MPLEWRRVHLGQLCEFRAGSAFPTRYQGQAAGDFPFIKVSDMELALNQRQIVQANHWVSDEVRRELRAALHPPGATVFAKIGVALTFNRRRLLTRPTIIDNNMMSAIPSNSSVNPTYFYYLLCQIDLNDIVSGTALPYVNARDLAQIEVKLPSLPEQRAIGAILGALDDKIELNRRMNETLEAMAQALFKSWFVDFEPFRDQGMEDSPLGPIPRGWRVGELNNIATFVKGVSYRSDDLQESTVALVTLKSVARGGGYQQEGSKPYIGEYKPEQQLQPGEVIVAHTDLTQAAEVLGRAARVQAHPQFPTLVASLDLVIVRSVGLATSNEFLYSLLSRSEFQEHAYGYANGTTVLHLSAKALPEYQCVLPPPTIIEAFTRLVHPVYQRIDHNEAESQTLAVTRDTLLPKLLSGEVRVKDAEKFVENAV